MKCFPPSAEVRRQLHNILRGCTADGATYPEVLFCPRDGAAHATLQEWVSFFLQDAPLSDIDDIGRTRFIHKLAAYINTVDVRRPETSGALMAGTLHFLRKPALLHDDTTFAQAVAQFRDGQKRINERRERLFKAHAHDIDASYDAVDRYIAMVAEPPPRVMWATGSYTLVEFIHPKHLCKQAREANNCLAHGRQKESADPRYWTQIRKGSRHIYSFRTYDKWRCILSFYDRALDEIQFSTQPIDYLPVLAQSLISIRRHIGDLAFDAEFPPFTTELKTFYEALLRRERP